MGRLESRSKLKARDDGLEEDQGVASIWPVVPANHRPFSHHRHVGNVFNDGQPLSVHRDHSTTSLGTSGIGRWSRRASPRTGFDGEAAMTLLIQSISHLERRWTSMLAYHNQYLDAMLNMNTTQPLPKAEWSQLKLQTSLHPQLLALRLSSPRSLLSRSY